MEGRENRFVIPHNRGRRAASRELPSGLNIRRLSEMFDANQAGKFKSTTPMDADDLLHSSG